MPEGAKTSGRGEGRYPAKSGPVIARTATLKPNARLSGDIFRSGGVILLDRRRLRSYNRATFWLGSAEMRNFIIVVGKRIAGDG